MKKLLVLSLSLFWAGLGLSGCAMVHSGEVEDQINGMVGFSKEHVLSCMGAPSSTAHEGATEVWSYNFGGPVTTSAVVSGNQSFVAGSATTSQQFCVINLTMQKGSVVAANYRSQGKLLSPSLPCYSVLHACVPDPSSSNSDVPTSSASDKIKDANAFCKDLYSDPQLDPLREIIGLGGAPTLKMQSDKHYVTDEQRDALDVYKTIHEKCRNKLIEASSKLAKAMVPLEAEADKNLHDLYEKKITIGQYNTKKQAELDKMRAALVKPEK